LMIRGLQNRDERFFVATRCPGSRCTAKSPASQNDPIEFREESVIEIRKIITTRETVFSELGVRQVGQLRGPWEWQ
jgi:hypothetical protein